VSEAQQDIRLIASLAKRDLVLGNSFSRPAGSQQAIATYQMVLRVAAATCRGGPDQDC
jgi:hypothetical protein